jgi:hypothetical protein
MFEQRIDVRPVIFRMILRVPFVAQPAVKLAEYVFNKARPKVCFDIVPGIEADLDDVGVKELAVFVRFVSFDAFDFCMHARRTKWAVRDRGKMTCAARRSSGAALPPSLERRTARC